MGCFVFLGAAVLTAQQQEKSFQQAALSNTNAIQEEHQNQSKYFGEDFNLNQKGKYQFAVKFKVQDKERKVVFDVKID